MIEIPKNIEIVDSTIKIERSFLPGCLGFADYQNSKILIDPSASLSMAQEVFYHELVHWILYKMHDKLESDEKFVGLFGSLLNQAIGNIGAKNTEQQVEADSAEPHSLT